MRRGIFRRAEDVIDIVRVAQDVEDHGEPRGMSAEQVDIRRRFHADDDATVSAAVLLIRDLGHVIEIGFDASEVDQCAVIAFHEKGRKRLISSVRSDDGRVDTADVEGELRHVVRLVRGVNDHRAEIENAADILSIVLQEPAAVLEQ
jgi:hypothetical protein